MSAPAQVYGLHAVRALLQRSARRVRRLVVDARRDDPRMREILQLAQQHDIRPERVDARQLAARLGQVSHQGVLAEVEPLPPWHEDELLDAVAAATDPLVLVLDGVQDPHNLGACLRTAEAVGVTAVIMPKDRSAGLTAVARKAAAGAAERVPLVAVTNLSRTLGRLKELGYWITGLAGDTDETLYDADLTGPTVLVMGAEGEGMRRLTREACDRVVKIPMHGKIESLNVSVATAVCLYEALRQRQPRKRAK